LCADQLMQALLSTIFV